MTPLRERLFDGRRHPRYISECMGRPLVVRIVTAVAVLVVLLGQVSSVAAGMLLCLDAGAGLDCCPGSAGGESSHLQDGSDCDCCFTVDVAPATAVTKSHKQSIDVTPGSVLLSDVPAPPVARVSRVAPGGADGPSLCSLRSVVLLI